MFDPIEYKRTKLHEVYGGSEQGGISYPAKLPMILLFNGLRGKQNGYENYWDDKGFYHYTGEGQVGDMRFNRGNKQLLEHEKNNKRVFLFDETKRSIYKYVGEMQIIDYTYFRGPDKNGNDRQAIRFILRSISEAKGSNQVDSKNVELYYNKPTKTEWKGLVTSRVGQGYYRNIVLERWSGKCAVTGINMKEILIASHIVPWSESTDEERLDRDNGILLCPNLDALFDKYLVSFEDDGKIIISKKISEEIVASMGINKNMRIDDLTKGNRKYLKRHREKFFTLLQS